MECRGLKWCYRLTNLFKTTPHALHLNSFVFCDLAQGTVNWLAYNFRDSVSLNCWYLSMKYHNHCSRRTCRGFKWCYRLTNLFKTTPHALHLKFPCILWPCSRHCQLISLWFPRQCFLKLLVFVNEIPQPLHLITYR